MVIWLLFRELCITANSFVGLIFLSLLSWEVMIGLIVLVLRH